MKLFHKIHQTFDFIVTFPPGLIICQLCCCCALLQNRLISNNFSRRRNDKVQDGIFVTHFYCTWFLNWSPQEHCCRSSRWCVFFQHNAKNLSHQEPIKNNTHSWCRSGKKSIWYNSLKLRGNKSFSVDLLLQETMLHGSLIIIAAKWQA